MRQKKHKKKILPIFLSVVILTIILLFWGVSLFYQKHFGPYTWINEIYCTGLSVEETNRLLEAQQPSPQITIVDKDGKEYILNLEEADYRAEFSTKLQVLKDLEGAFSWLTAANNKKYYDVACSIYIDNEKLKKQWEALELCAEPDKAVECLEIRYGEQGYYLYDGLQKKLDSEKGFSLLCERIHEGEKRIDLASEECYYEEKLTGEQKETLKVWEQLSPFLDCNIVFDMGAEQIPVDGGVISQFLVAQNQIPVFDEAGQVLFDDEKIKAYVQELCREYNTVKASREFQSTRGDLISVAYVKYGTELDEEAEISFLTQALRDSGSYGGSAKLHIPKYKKEGYFRGKDDIGSTYIEIDMTEQRLYYYEDGEQVIATDVVTGCTKRKRGTPEGINYVYAKQRNRTLRGEGYAAFVKYWMPINGNIGIHDASWRDEFGGDLYIKGGSHGCINTPTDAMEKLYELVEVGTPAITFY